METLAPPKSVRSPSYPSMSLPSAIAGTSKIDSKYRTSPVDRVEAARLLGYTSLSGPANKALAALSSYGLVESAGKGEMRVTTLAQAILHPQDDAERNQALKTAAFNPGLFYELQEKYPNIVPPEEGVANYLNRQGFNQSAVKPAARAYLQTLSYLEEWGASKSHSHKSTDARESASTSGKAGLYGGAQVGDFIQWESKGALQFETHLRVRMVSDDGQWVAVEGSETGVPMNEVLVEKSAPKAPPTFPMGEGLADPQKGEIEWMRNKVGQDTSVRLLVRGDMGPKEIGRLIKLLEAQKEVLED
jgi:hypothetical protein